MRSSFRAGRRPNRGGRTDRLRGSRGLLSWRIELGIFYVHHTVNGAEGVNEARIASPAATGGAGPLFEQHVDAYWLALLLVRAMPPILLDCVVSEVHLQTNRLGWNTDDVLIAGERGAGGVRKLVVQVKRSFTVSASDAECVKTIQDFWKDFRAAERFTAEVDRFALVVRRGSSALLSDFAGLIDCALAARNAAEFEQRLGTPGLVSAKAVAYCGEIRKIIEAHEGRTASASEMWPFLRVLRLIHLDLQTATAQHEALVKTLLAHTTAEPDPRASADATWNELLALAGHGMAEGRSFRLNDLPEQLRWRHVALAGTDQRALRALTDHAAPILQGIRSTIGDDVHLRRAPLVQNVIDRLDSSQVVLVAGPAGSGKSAVARDALARVCTDYFTCGFRAEELAQGHFDGTLQSAGVGANTVAVQAALASQDRKIVFVESVERLLEKTAREAFTDLLGLAARDQSLRVLLTCRDYSTDLVRDCFLVSTGVEHVVVQVPPLSDAELAEVGAACPQLARPLASETLRRILRNPYFLDKAAQIPWATDRPLPASERDFRALFWRQIVRDETHLADGMPQRREQAFEAITLRRARALTVYVSSADLDPAAVESLRHDALVASAETSPSLVAPAHDVLEDWAILRWIEKEHAAQGGSFTQLAGSIGPHPAVRRAYRTWVAELLDLDPTAADRLFESAVLDITTPMQFRDDTLVSLLRAPGAAAFLERNSASLLADNLDVFRRVIHLLRVACVTAPSWAPSGTNRAWLFNVPDGPAWAAVVHLVHQHREAFPAKDRLLLLGLLEDWAHSVTYTSPYPPGAESAAAIAHSLLPGYAASREDSPGRRIMNVIAKIPLSARPSFEALLRGSKADRERTTEEFREVIFAGLEGIPAGRDVPDVVIDTGLDYLLCREEHLHDRDYGFSTDLELTFGIREGLRHDYFPASALRGPWMQLLSSHPDKGLAFFVKVFNHSADWYAHPRVPERVESPVETELTFADGTTRKQWINGRLWGWYRGTTVGPYVLQSLLMAFERWLLDYAKAHPEALNATLTDILRRSDSAALTAVVASVATAFPRAAGEALLALLSSPLCLMLDRQRMALESRAPSGLSGLLPSRAEQRIYEEERKQADALPHRHYDLEQAIANLQLGPLAPRVHQILDRHRAALPPTDQQHDDHRTWRLAMHRMDLRQYTVSEVEVTLAEPTPGDDVPARRRLLRFDPREPEPDVQEMVSASAARWGTLDARMRLLMWGHQTFKHEEGATADPALWQEHLQAARVPEDGADPSAVGLTRGGPGIVAAVCVRDHWEELSDDERGWCVRRVCAETTAHADVWDETARAQRYDMAADRACAWVLSRLLGKAFTDADRSDVQTAFMAALTHATDEVRWYAVWGVADHLWTIDRDLAVRSINALALEAALLEKAWRGQERRRYDRRRAMMAIMAETATFVRGAFWKDGGIPSDAYDRLDASGWFGAAAEARALTILSRAPDDPMAVAAFAQAAQRLVDWWKSDDRRRGHRERDHDDEIAITQRLQDFVMHTSPASAQSILAPILGALDKHGREAHWIIKGLTSVEDGQTNTPQYWLIWDLFADRVRTAAWLPDLDDDYCAGDEVISAIFLGSWWKDHIRHWKSLEGYAHHVHKLFEDLPPTARVLDAYVRFLYHIGEQSLPAAFVLISNRLRVGDAPTMLKNSNTIFMLEVLLLRHVYSRPLELKRQVPIRDAVLSLLDILVENGSSAAFRMRDDFVTPVALA